MMLDMPWEQSIVWITGCRITRQCLIVVEHDGLTGYKSFDDLGISYKTDLHCQISAE